MSLALNFSNHPIATWPAAQHAEAIARFGRVVDVPGGMPLVPPHATSAEVVALAESLAQTARDQGATHAVVVGEPTLSFALVTRLIASGIQCFAPTTERSAIEAHGPDDAIERRSTYRFVTFREYAC